MWGTPCRAGMRRATPFSPVLLGILFGLDTCLPSTRSTVGTYWVQVYSRPTEPGQGAADSPGMGGVTGILLAASFMPVCSVAGNGERMAVTSNNICIAGSHWGAPFLRLRGGVQGFDASWRKREVGLAKTKRQARVERGKKLKAVMGGKEHKGHKKKKVSLQDQEFKSEWHRTRALHQAERRYERKMSRTQANFTKSVLPPSQDSQIMVAGSGDEDEEGEVESVPSSILREMQRIEREGDASGSDIVVLDGEGNPVSLIVPPLRSAPGEAEAGGGQREFEEFTRGAELRPYTDAEGNVKWIDTRSEETKDQHRQAALKHSGEADSSSQALQLDPLRGGAAPRYRMPARQPVLASYGGISAGQTLDDVSMQQDEERRRMLRYEQSQVHALTRKVVILLFIPRPLCVSLSAVARVLPCAFSCCCWRPGCLIGLRVANVVQATRFCIYTPHGQVGQTGAREDRSAVSRTSPPPPPTAHPATVPSQRRPRREKACGACQTSRGPPQLGLVRKAVSSRHAG